MPTHQKGGTGVLIRKACILVLSIVMMVVAGRSFATHLREKEPIVAGPGVSKVANLSDYFSPLKGTPGDTPVYIMDGPEEGGSVLIIAGDHPNEISGVLASVIFIENAEVLKGRVFLVPFSNDSAFTVSHPGEATPQRYHIQTSWGERWFRFGDRWTNPLHQWPDPEVYTHYPSGQPLSGFDIRNLNRCYPGKADGALTEQVGHGISELIRQENIDLTINLHEAEPMYPVINTIVSHQRSIDIGVITAIDLAIEEGIRIGNEISPEKLRGLAHRELGDHTDTLVLLMETCNPIQDPCRGRTDEELLLTGRDDFILRASELGLLFVPYDAHGSPVDERVGRNTSSILKMIETFSDFYPEKEIVVSGFPRMSEVLEHGVGAYLRNPEDIVH
jgi:hypothetical protein